MPKKKSELAMTDVVEMEPEVEEVESDLVVQDEHEIVEFDLDELALLGVDSSEVVQQRGPQIPRMSIMQTNSDDVADKEEVLPGMIKINFGVDGGDPVYTKSVKVFMLDAFLGQTMFPTDDSGKKDMTKKEPVCASNNGEQPRSNYHGTTLRDYRNGKSVTITSETQCAKCPLGNWKTIDGNKMKPPCAPSPQFILFDVDHDTPVLLQSSAYNVRSHLTGFVDKSDGGKVKVSGLPDYFDEEKKPFLTGDPQRPVRAVVMSTKRIKTQAGTNAFVPVFAWEGGDLTPAQIKRLLELKKLYEQEKWHDQLTSPGYAPDGGYEGGYDEDESSTSYDGPVGDGAVLGAGDNRRIGSSIKAQVEAAMTGNQDEDSPF